MSGTAATPAENARERMRELRRREDAIARVHHNNERLKIVRSYILELDQLTTTQLERVVLEGIPWRSGHEFESCPRCAREHVPDPVRVVALHELLRRMLLDAAPEPPPMVLRERRIVVRAEHEQGRS